MLSSSGTILPMVSTDVLKAKSEASSSISSDVERFLASGGAIEKLEGQDVDSVSYVRLQKAKRNNYYKKKAEAKAMYRRLAMIDRANKKLNG